MSWLELLMGVILGFLEGMMWFSFAWAQAFGSCLWGRVGASGHVPDWLSVIPLILLTLMFWGFTAVMLAMLVAKCRGAV